jgi:t-SNARE complex subunit (syntaxin)
MLKALQIATSTEKRIRANMQGTLTQKFLELAQEYQEVQTNYKNKYQVFFSLLLFLYNDNIIK